MATHGSVVQFDPAKEEWTSYIERLDYYLIANEVFDDAKKCAMLMSGCGPTVYKIIPSLVDVETRKTIKYAKLVKILVKHFNPKPSSIVQRFKFYNRTQKNVPGKNGPARPILDEKIVLPDHFWSTKNGPARPIFGN